MPSEQGRPVYIGDGVYLDDDGYQLWLSVNSDLHGVVALDRETFLSLVKEGEKRFSEMSQRAR